MSRRSRPDRERFEEKYVPEPNTGCWFWIAAVIGRGYGQFRYQGRLWVAHRVSWELAYGPVPAELWVLHKCDQPCCVNPEHLFLGTHDDNMDDMVRKARSASGVRNGAVLHRERMSRCDSERHKAAVRKLTDSDVLEIRRLAALGGLTQTELGARFGISQRQVSNVVRLEQWKNPVVH